MAGIAASSTRLASAAPVKPGVSASMGSALASGDRLVIPVQGSLGTRRDGGSKLGERPPCWSKRGGANPAPVETEANTRSLTNIEDAGAVCDQRDCLVSLVLVAVFAPLQEHEEVTVRRGDDGRLMLQML